MVGDHNAVEGGNTCILVKLHGERTQQRQHSAEPQLPIARDLAIATFCWWLKLNCCFEDAVRCLGRSRTDHETLKSTPRTRGRESLSHSLGDHYCGGGVISNRQGSLNPISC
jgi:hypothetical protein